MAFSPESVNPLRALHRAPQGREPSPSAPTRGGRPAPLRLGRAVPPRRPRPPNPHRAAPREPHGAGNRDALPGSNRRVLPTDSAPPLVGPDLRGGIRHGGPPAARATLQVRGEPLPDHVWERPDAPPPASAGPHRGAHDRPHSPPRRGQRNRG